MQVLASATVLVGTVGQGLMCPWPALTLVTESSVTTYDVLPRLPSLDNLITSAFNGIDTVSQKTVMEAKRKREAVSIEKSNWRMK